MKLDLKIEDLLDKDEPEFENMVEIATGAFGQVYRAFHPLSRKEVAVKIIRVNNDQVAEDIILEVGILRICNHPNIVKLIGSYLHQNKLYIAMELCDGGTVNEIFKYQKDPLKECEISIILQDVLKGLAYLHAQKIIHRDIKGQNILLTSAAEVKLVDFGVSAWCIDGRKAKSFIGTPYWMAPEVVDTCGEFTPYTEKADIWSIGILGIELAESKPPLADINPMRALMAICSSPPPQLKQPEKWSNEFQEFLSLCLSKDPQDRSSAGSLLEHRFFHSCDPKDLVELLQKCKNLQSGTEMEEDEEEKLLRDVLAQIDEPGLEKEKEQEKDQDKIISDKAKKRSSGMDLQRQITLKHHRLQEKNHLIQIKFFHQRVKAIQSLRENHEKEKMKLVSKEKLEEDQALIENDFVLQLLLRQHEETLNQQMLVKVRTMQQLQKQQKSALAKLNKHLKTEQDAFLQKRKKISQLLTNRLAMITTPPSSIRKMSSSNKPNSTTGAVLVPGGYSESSLKLEKSRHKKKKKKMITSLLSKMKTSRTDSSHTASPITSPTSAPRGIPFSNFGAHKSSSAIDIPGHNNHVNGSISGTPPSNMSSPPPTALSSPSSSVLSSAASSPPSPMIQNDSLGNDRNYSPRRRAATSSTTSATESPSGSSLSSSAQSLISKKHRLPHISPPVPSLNNNRTSPPISPPSPASTSMIAFNVRSPNDSNQTSPDVTPLTDQLRRPSKRKQLENLIKMEVNFSEFKQQMTKKELLYQKYEIEVQQQKDFEILQQRQLIELHNLELEQTEQYQQQLIANFNDNNDIVLINFLQARYVLEVECTEYLTNLRTKHTNDIYELDMKHQTILQNKEREVQKSQVTAENKMMIKKGQHQLKREEKNQADVIKNLIKTRKGEKELSKQEIKDLEKTLWDEFNQKLQQQLKQLQDDAVNHQLEQERTLNEYYEWKRTQRHQMRDALLADLREKKDQQYKDLKEKYVRKQEEVMEKFSSEMRVIHQKHTDDLLRLRKEHNKKNKSLLEAQKAAHVALCERQQRELEQLDSPTHQRASVDYQTTILHQFEISLKSLQDSYAREVEEAKQVSQQQLDSLLSRSAMVCSENDPTSGSITPSPDYSFRNNLLSQLETTKSDQLSDLYLAAKLKLKMRRARTTTSSQGALPIESLLSTPSLLQTTKNLFSPRLSARGSNLALDSIPSSINITTPLGPNTPNKSSSFTETHGRSLEGGKEKVSSFPSINLQSPFSDPALNERSFGASGIGIGKSGIGGSRSGAETARVRCEKSADDLISQKKTSYSDNSNSLDESSTPPNSSSSSSEDSSSSSSDPSSSSDVEDNHNVNDPLPIPQRSSSLKDQENEESISSSPLPSSEPVVDENSTTFQVSSPEFSTSDTRILLTGPAKSVKSVTPPFVKLESIPIINVIESTPTPSHPTTFLSKEDVEKKESLDREEKQLEEEEEDEEDEEDDEYDDDESEDDKDVLLVGDFSEEDSDDETE
eukprot:TRINITY_DN193_c4_g1_i1.p1 TRINITY_DN193_c4_g1~~TRINITY_DN193_c4_g1_i1.p1  ORF type:complete len:1486 (+),score=446.16 TRINITY_DN193_c4_g1_i1:89-4546(+)